MPSSRDLHFIAAIHGEILMDKQMPSNDSSSLGCGARGVPPELVAEAARLAIEENPENGPEQGSAQADGAGPVDFLVVDVTRRWKQGRTLGVAFLNGTAKTQQWVKDGLAEWCKWANIKFQPSSNPEIRVEFTGNPAASSSALGTDCLLAHYKGKATMSLATPPSAYTVEYMANILHEIGHALGCTHEHQSPAGGIQWNKEKVYQYYGAPLALEPGDGRREPLQAHRREHHSIFKGRYEVDHDVLLPRLPDPQWRRNPTQPLPLGHRQRIHQAYVSVRLMPEPGSHVAAPRAQKNGRT
jgi:hypothetical protein